MISGYHYDQDSRALSIRYPSGAVWQHANVPPAKIAAMLAAPSVGKYLNERIAPYHPGKKT